MGRINPLVAIGLPTWGKVSVSWARSYRHLGGPLGSTMVELPPVVGESIAKARNILMQQAIDNKCEFLFMIGDDVLAPGDVIPKFLHRMREHPEIDLLTGVYWTKSWPTYPYMWRDIQRGPYMDWKHGEFIEIDFAGCDCLMIRLSDRVKAQGPDWFATDWLWEESQEKPDEQLNTEDFYFYTKLRKAGIKLWCDTSAQCIHEDRDSGMQFGLTTEMPQVGGEPWKLPEPGTDNPKTVIAEIGCGVDTPWFGPTDKVKIIRFDINGCVKPDYRCDVRHLPVPDQCVDMVHCFPSGEYVLTPQGFVDISKVAKESSIISHTKSEQAVIETFQHAYTGTGYLIKPFGYSIGFRVTPGHPLYGYRAKRLGGSVEDWKHRMAQIDAVGKPEWIPSQELEAGDVLVLPIPEYVSDIKSFDLGQYLNSSIVADYEAVSTLPLHKGHKVSANVVRQTAQDIGITFSTIRGWRYHGKRPFGFYSTDSQVTWHGARKESSVNRYIAVGPELMRLLGYWLADGWIHGDQIGFIFGEHETEYAQDVSELMDKLFGVTPIKDMPDGTHTSKIRYTNRALAEAWSIISEGSKGAHNKKLPSWAYWVCPEWQRELLIGFIRGDGCLSRDCRHEASSTVSRVLAEGLRFLYLRCGISAGIDIIPPQASEIKGRKVNGSEAYHVAATIDRKRCKGTYVREGTLYSMVREVSNVNLSESVYNFQVAVDESYLTPFVASHNSKHVLEHFSRNETMKVLNEWSRILRIGGEFHIVVPNLAKTIDWILKMDTGEAAVDPYPWWQLYGSQQDETDIHKNGFTVRRIELLLKRMGIFDESTIKVTTQDGDDINVHGVAVKNRHPQPYSVIKEWDTITEQEKLALDGLKTPEEAAAIDARNLQLLTTGTKDNTTADSSVATVEGLECPAE